MKIITLNTWGGTLGSDLFDFFRKYSDTDVFLLQEVFHSATDITAWKQTDRRELFREICELLPTHRGHFAAAESDEWGLASFVRKNVSTKEIGDIFVHNKKDSMVGRDGTTLGKNMQYLRLEKNGSPITIINLHGLWNGKGKTDTEDRINQSKKISDFIKNIQHEVILAGDFNLRPDTESLKMLEKGLNLQNLISTYGITSTRTSHYKKSEKYADYILISNGVIVKDFKVLPEEPSDHAALYLEYQLHE